MIPRLTALVITTLISSGASIMANEAPKSNSITWLSVPGMGQQPPSLLTYDENSVTAYSWGSHVVGDFIYQDTHVPVGKFKSKLTTKERQSLAKWTESTIDKFSELKSARDIDQLTSFIINSNGKILSGNYADVGDSYAKKWWPLSSIYTDTVLHGDPIASFKSMISINQTGSGLSASLTFINVGREIVTIEGPATWTNDPNMLPLQHVIVDGHSDATGYFSFALSRGELIEGEQYAHEISIPVNGSVKLVFDIPYDSLQYIKGKPGTITSGNYGFGATIKTKILFPKDMEGVCIAATQPLSDVPLHAQP